MQYDLSELKKNMILKENIFIMLQCRTTNSKFEKIGTEEPQIDTSIELSESVDLFIK